MSVPEISVVLPCFNELPNLPELRRRLVSVLEATGRTFEILFVDDNSPDGTGDLIAGLAESNTRIHLLRRPGKLGLGTAYRDGFHWALQRDYELIFEMDADFSHDPAHLTEFMKAAEQSGMQIQFQDLDELAETLLKDLEAEKFVSMIGIEAAGETLRQRAEKIGRGEAPIDEHSYLA